MKQSTVRSPQKRLVFPTSLGLIGLLVIVITVDVGAIAGGLDPAFGTNGKVFTHITNGDDIANDIALQTDGKIVVAGTANAADIVVARYNVNGSLDVTFDGDGVVVTDINGQFDGANDIAIQSDGKIVVVGDSLVGGNYDFAVVRYNPDGSLDTSFDGDGKVTTDIAGLWDGAQGVAIQGDGKIVVAGHTVGQTTDNDFAVVRYETNGALDSMFGSGGKFTTNLTSSDVPLRDFANAVAIQGDGKIVVVGSSWYDPFVKFALIRLNANGTLDTSFGGDGRVTQLIGDGWDVAFGVAIQSDGKIVAGGNCGPLPLRFGVARFNTDGSLDGSFGPGGVAATRMGNGSSSPASSLFLQSDGKIVMAGSGSFGAGGPDFAVAKFSANGSLEGKAVTPIGSMADNGYGVAVQNDGRIVVAGGSLVAGAGTEFAIARYDLIPLHSSPRRFDFDGDGKSDLGVIRPSNGRWYVLNSGFGNLTEVEYNLPDDKMAPADYNGDGKTEIANFRNGTWRILSMGPDVYFGQAGDIPVPGDYDGDTLADRAVFRQGTWYLMQSRDGVVGFGFGISTDKPVPEDYDGDGKYDPAVYRDGTWYILNSTTGYTAVQFGLINDKPIPADYDGDDRADVAVYRNGTWYILGSTSGFRAVQFGISTDIPAPADYDGDYKADIAVYRDGTWYMLRSTDGSFVFQTWGQAGDIPVESVYVR